jgi:hypothetical protein
MGRVTHLETLAIALHNEVDLFVRIARGVQTSHNRTESIRQQLLEHESQRLRLHGVSDPEAAASTILGMDLALDAQGLDFWLKRA